MGALSALFLKSNGLLNKDSGKALAGALIANSVLTELDISNNFDQLNKCSQDGAGFAQALVIGLIDGTMTSLNLSSNDLGSEGAKHVAEAMKVSVQ
jgi:hypothetical protein